MNVVNLNKSEVKELCDELLKRDNLTTAEYLFLLDNISDINELKKYSGYNKFITKNFKPNSFNLDLNTELNREIEAIKFKFKYPNSRERFDKINNALLKNGHKGISYSDNVYY